MMFGALSTCPLCSSHLHYSGAMYRCHGFLTAWSKCSYSTHEPERRKGKWKIPEDTDNQFLQKLAELMKMLFNVETYRAAMMEFEINMSEMPLGKLSKSNIQKGFERKYRIS